MLRLCFCWPFLPAWPAPARGAQSRLPQGALQSTPEAPGRVEASPCPVSALWDQGRTPGPQQPSVPGPTPSGVPWVPWLGAAGKAAFLYRQVQGLGPADALRWAPSCGCRLAHALDSLPWREVQAAHVPWAGRPTLTVTAPLCGSQGASPSGLGVVSHALALLLALQWARLVLAKNLLCHSQLQAGLSRLLPSRAWSALLSPWSRSSPQLPPGPQHLSPVSKQPCRRRGPDFTGVPGPRTSGPSGEGLSAEQLARAAAWAGVLALGPGVESLWRLSLWALPVPREIELCTCPGPW